MSPHCTFRPYFLSSNTPSPPTVSPAAAVLENVFDVPLVKRSGLCPSMNLVYKIVWPIEFNGYNAVAISRSRPYETGNFPFDVLGFWLLEPSHYAAHGVAHTERQSDPQPSAPLSSRPTASTNLPAMWVSHLGGGSSSSQVIASADATWSRDEPSPFQACPNCRFMSYINDCCFKLLGLTYFVTHLTQLPCPLKFFSDSLLLLFF